MRFVCYENKFTILEMAAVELGIEYPILKKFVEIKDEKLIAIARTLGMEELTPAISNEEAIRRLGIEELVSPAPENGAGMPRCEICGKPVKSKRAKTCSDECTREKQRRYAREYYHRKDKTTEDAGGVDSSPLSGSEKKIPLVDWGSDPGDEPVRAGGLG